MNADKIPDIIIGRLPIYLRALQRMSEKGMKTRVRPGMVTCRVSRAPLVPMGSFCTWTRISWPSLTTSRIGVDFDFNIAKILHINTLVIWLMMGFMGAIYWFLPEEFNIETVGIAAAEVLFYVFCAAVGVVAIVFIFVQYGGSDAIGMWFVNQGRKYVEAPRWAAIGVVIVMLVFAYNVIGTAIRAKKMTGIMAVLIIDLVPLIILYLNAFAAYRFGK